LPEGTKVRFRSRKYRSVFFFIFNSYVEKSSRSSSAVRFRVSVIQSVFSMMKEEITRAKDRSLKIASRGRKRERERVVVARRRRRRKERKTERKREKRKNSPRA